MKAKKYSEEQIIGALQEVDHGAKVGIPTELVAKLRELAARRPR